MSYKQEINLAYIDMLKRLDSICRQYTSMPGCDDTEMYLNKQIIWAYNIMLAALKNEYKIEGHDVFDKSSNVTPLKKAQEVSSRIFAVYDKFFYDEEKVDHETALQIIQAVNNIIADYNKKT